MIFIPYVRTPDVIHDGKKSIAEFKNDPNQANVDKSVVESFGAEWNKFNSFDANEIKKIGDLYFDILPGEVLNDHSKVLDVGCGSGRWSKYLTNKVGSIDAVDPSSAIFAADKLLADFDNIRLTMATTESLPFPDNSFDMVMSVGVLHHIPDTLQAIKDCISKVKPGGYFYTYLYYSLDNRGWLFRFLFKVSNIFRYLVSRLPSVLKKIACDIIAVVIYMPFVLVSQGFYKIGFKKLAEKMPLSIYRDKGFFIIRNDALDRFGTKLEQRFSRKYIREMLTESGITEIRFSEKAPYWHVIGKK
jgi:ubiquinone/menaquinone biosynthesis C-methylase UbiE